MAHPDEQFHYTLMNKDTELIKFSLKPLGEELPELSDIRVLESNPIQEADLLKNT